MDPSSLQALYELPKGAVCIYNSRDYGLGLSLPIYSLSFFLLFPPAVCVDCTTWNSGQVQRSVNR